MKPNPLSVLGAIVISAILFTITSCEDPSYAPSPADWETEFNNHVEAARLGESPPSNRYIIPAAAKKAREMGEYLTILDHDFGTPERVVVEKFYCNFCKQDFWNHELDEGYCPKCGGTAVPTTHTRDVMRFHKR